MVALNEIHGFHLNFHFKKMHVIYLLLIFFVSNIALSSCYEALATSDFINKKPHNLKDVTQLLIKKYMGRRITIIDCFWGRSLYPFGTYLKAVHNTYTGYNFTVKYYSTLINETRLAVIGTVSEIAGNLKIKGQLFQLYANNVVFRNDNYTMIDLSPIQSFNGS